MALLTYLPRLLPALLLSGRPLPGPVLEGLGLLPPAILGALVGRAVFLPDGQLDVSLTNPVLVPALITAFIGWRTRHLAWTVVAGLLAAASYRFIVS